MEVASFLTAMPGYSHNLFSFGILQVLVLARPLCALIQDAKPEKPQNFTKVKLTVFFQFISLKWFLMVLEPVCTQKLSLLSKTVVYVYRQTYLEMLHTICQCLFCISKQLKSICSFSVYIPAELDLFNYNSQENWVLFHFSSYQCSQGFIFLQLPTLCLMDTPKPVSFQIVVSGFLKSLNRV